MYIIIKASHRNIVTVLQSYYITGQVIVKCGFEL